MAICFRFGGKAGSSFGEAAGAGYVVCRVVGRQKVTRPTGDLDGRDRAAPVVLAFENLDACRVRGYFQ